ncbi:NIF3-like protein 1 isoform X1 [Lampris incognitus]|nr:NIF3-like protein 1 isoform X1 [Lampris incognitus]XP_056157643.1 NIF3-like protein 1 isoform X1 [Lampris incognitus]XP_056157644.1 NIF3-like protein 1 isoform X1 [Lampris incognitus]
MLSGCTRVCGRFVSLTHTTARTSRSPFISLSTSPSFRPSFPSSSSIQPILAPLVPSLHLPFPLRRFLSRSAHPTGPMDLQEVLVVLEKLAPLSLAESWDNVGLLVEPSRARPIKTILLTNDLTDAVMEEAEAMSCDLIISYHPPLFRPVKRLVQGDWKQRLAVRAIEGGMAVFSPHTSWDSVKGGVNDWLVAGLGSGQVSVLSQAHGSAPHSHKLEFTVRNDAQLNDIMEELRRADSRTLLQYSVNSSDSSLVHVSVTCSDSALTSSVQTVLRQVGPSHSLSILQLQKPPLPGHGQGRLSVLEEPVTVATAVQKMKSHLGLNHVRLALGAGQTVESTVCTAAVCAGSGASVLSGVKADLYVTGEMSHHEVLDAVSRGTSVILSDHSNSERGFLTVFRERLAMRLPDSVTVAISQADRDPLEVV